jgi:hypothetical protein
MKRIVGIVLGLGLACAAHAAIIADDVIYVDFGHTPSSGNTNNISSSLGALSVADAIRLSDGAATGVGIAVAQSPASSTYTEANTVAGNALSTDATACGDALGRNNGGAATMSITFTGLDTSLCYDLTGGVSVDNSIAYKYATGWTVGSIRLVSYATASTGYITFDELTTSDGTLTITLDNNNVNHLAVSQLTLTAHDHITEEEMMSYLPGHLSAFPDYSWDKISRWGGGRKNAAWTAAEMEIMASNCKYIWLAEEPNECARFLAAYPDNMYCFNSYMNLAKAYVHPADKPEYFLYSTQGGLIFYSGGHEAYNLTNPECREWWLNRMDALAYGSPQTDIIFLDALMKVLIIDGGNYFDYWGNRVGDDYMEKYVKPFLARIRDRYSEDFIIQGNFIRARSTDTPDGNLSYCEYVHSSYLENIELPDDENYVEYVHETIEYVQQAVDQGKLIAPNMNPVKPTVCADMTIEEKRAKASAAMPVFWAKLGAGEQDELAEMYAYFDMKLAIFLVMAGEQSYFRYGDAVTVDTGGTDIFKMVPPFPEFDRKLGNPISDGVRISDTTWERQFEYCKVTLNVDGGVADIDWTHRANPSAENMAEGKPTEQSDLARVLYQSDFTGADLASAGLATSAGANGTWILDTANDVLSGARTGYNPRANVYTIDSWQNDEALTLHVTFNQEISGARYSFGLVDANYTVSSSGDCFNSGLAGAYGIGFSASGDLANKLIFNNGSGSTVLSTAQGANTPGTIETMTITVTSDSYSYSLNGAEPTTGSLNFDTSRAFRFVAHAHDVDEQYISNITIAAVTASTDWWEADLEAIREIGDIDVWPGPFGFSDFYVLVSTDPFQSKDLNAALAQPGVTAVHVEGQCASPTVIPFDIAGRYVQIQSTEANYLDMAEVQVWSPVNKPAPQISLSEGGLVLSWSASDGQSYNVETNADLTNPAGWAICTNIVGDGAAVSFTNTPAQVQLFYKVTSESPGKTKTKTGAACEF